MSAVPIIMMMMQQNHRRMEEDNRRRREEEARRRRQREEEERERKKERKRTIEHRKNSPVICNNESWQHDRCVKAISLQTPVQTLIRTIEDVKPQVIEDEERKCDEKILATGYEYEILRQDLESDIESLKELGISINGSQYTLIRLTSTNTHIGNPERITEFLGSTFTINNGQPIELNPEILSNKTYYKDRYEEMDPVELERNYIDTLQRMRKYERFGKYLKFLLHTRKYLELEEDAETLSEDHNKCELRKKEMQSFQSLNKKQLLAIKSYFKHIAGLSSISTRLEKLFREKAYLREESNERIYELALKEIMSNGEFDELVSQVSEYITKIYENDEETLNGAYELVKGEYPIKVSRRFIYELLIANLKNYKKEELKELKLS